MSDDATWPIATQRQMLHCWSEGVMGTRNLPEYMTSTLRDHPIPRDLFDPIFHSNGDKPNNGWSSARGTRSVSAIASMRSWLKRNTLRAHPEVEAAWERTDRRSAAVAPIEGEVRAILREAWESDDVETGEDFVDFLVRRLEDYREQLR